MAGKRNLKRTPEERKRWLENQRRLERLIDLRLERDGVTRDEIRRRLGLPSYRVRGLAAGETER